MCNNFAHYSFLINSVLSMTSFKTIKTILSNILTAVYVNFKINQVNVSIKLSVT